MLSGSETSSTKNSEVFLLNILLGSGSFVSLRVTEERLRVTGERRLPEKVVILSRAKNLGVRTARFFS